MSLKKVKKFVSANVSGTTATGEEFGAGGVLALLEDGDVYVVHPVYLNDVTIDEAALLADLKRRRTKSLEEAETILAFIEALGREA